VIAISASVFIGGGINQSVIPSEVEAAT
jgi:hypothetical protein